jgi:multidrug efflux pump subunit AcrA (membrane-fusion protein)
MNDKGAIMKKPILPAFAIAALALGVFSIARTQPRRETASPPSAPPDSIYAHCVAAVGLVETSTENIAIGTSLSDVVTEVPANVGQTVKRGDILFRLDDRHLRAELAARQADLRVAQAQVSVDAAVLRDLTQQLGFAEGVAAIDKRAISADDLTRRRSAVQTAQARLEQARARVEAASAQIQVIATQIERSVVRAPIDGDVLQVKVHPGEFAPAASASATPLVLLGRLKPLHIRVDVDEHEAWRVRTGARATAAVRGNVSLTTPLIFVRFEPFVLPKKSLTGDSTERVDTRVLQVIYRVENDDLPLFVGQQMDVFIEDEVQQTSRNSAAPTPASPPQSGCRRR